jgi:hypothetical protein
MKKELLILAVVIVVLLAYLVLKKSDNVQYDMPELETLKVDDLDKIEITKPDLTITLVKKDSKWLIDPQGYPTDEEKIKKISETVSGLTLTDLVSKAKNYSRYHLHKDKAISVKAYQKDKIVRQFEIGKAAPTYGHTYVKLKDDTNVYHAHESFRNDFDKKIDDLRDKTVMKLDKNEITGLEVDKEGAKYSFTRKVETPTPPAPLKPEDKKDEKQPETVTPPQKQEEVISWLLPDGKKGKTSEVDSLIGQFTDLSCDKYIENKTKEDFKDQSPLYTIKLKGSKDFVLTLYKKLEEGDDKGKYPVISSENPYPFLLSSYKGDQIMKKPEDLIEKTEEAPKSAK